MKKDRVNLFNASILMAVATLLSRMLGFLRDILIIWLLGTSFYSDAFLAAFRIPETFRKMCAEGSLSASFIPLFSKNAKDSSKFKKKVGSAFRLIVIYMIPVVIGGVILSPYLMKIFAGGFYQNSLKFDLTVELSQMMFPYLFFVSLSAVSMGALNSLGHFASPAFSSVVLNITIILFLTISSLFTDNPVIYLAIGVTTGGIFQFLIQVPSLKKRGVLFPKVKRIEDDVRETLIKSLSSIIGLSLAQINILTGTIIATFLTQGSVTYLYLADRLVQFPLSVFSSSVSNAFFPEIAKSEDINEINRLYLICIKQVLFLIIPAMVGLIILREPVIKLLFMGKLTISEISVVGNILLYYSLGMWIWAINKITVSVFYSLNNTYTPARTSIISLFLNIILAVSFIYPFGISGVAIASTISGLISILILIFVLNKKNGIVFTNIFSSTCKVLFNSGIMGIVVFLLFRNPGSHYIFIKQAFLLFFIIFAGIMVYILCSYITKSDELLTLVKYIKGKDRKDEQKA
jgi:putative peptidoglycan lipid II flippase